ncbi:hypothetical protein AHiyo6_14200 [Arthrobacter sp. Hiyo6]|nr:hypothetical protein AHiyo6_14200 [Arthrobacter sp. Hiyo6]
MPYRKASGSAAPVLAASSSATYIVGTPMNTLTRCCTNNSRAAAPVNRGSITMVAPARRPVFNTTVCPKVWNNGSPPKSTSPRWKSKVLVRRTLVCSTRAKCVPSAPLGLPVVPEVYRMVAVSSGRRGR